MMVRILLVLVCSLLTFAASAQVSKQRVSCYPPLAAVLRSGADPSSVSTGANTVICTGARDGRCDERS